MEGCIFCKIINNKLPSCKIYEDSKCLVFLDIKPVNKGHLLVVPKKHDQYIKDLDDELVGHLFKVAKKMNKAIRDSDIPCGDINFLLADGPQAGQEVYHVHLHVIPRLKNDGFGFKFPKNYNNLPSQVELEEVADKIKKCL